MAENEKTATINLAQLQVPMAPDSITLLEAFGILWSRKLFLLACMSLGALIGIGVGMWIRPQFTSDALLQVNVKGGNKATKAMGEMGALLDVSSPADAEIELIKSRMVLDYVVDAERLAYSATPISKLNRLLHREGRMDIEELNIPALARTERWIAEAQSANTYVVYTPEGSKLLEGKVGDRLSAPYAGDTLVICVKLMRASDGEKFVLRQTNPLMAVRRLARSLSVSERGKQRAEHGRSHPRRRARRIQIFHARKDGRLLRSGRKSPPRHQGDPQPPRFRGSGIPLLAALNRRKAEPEDRQNGLPGHIVSIGHRVPDHGRSRLHRIEPL